jgi:hypothetical protein
METVENEMRCGVYQANQYLVAQGGLNASYFTNKWFSPYSNPYLQSIDAQVNFNWGDSSELIKGTSREYISIQWKGFLEILQDGPYTFYIEVDDGVKLTIGSQVLIDDLTNNEDSSEPKKITSQPISLKAGSLVPIEIKYF